TAREPNLRGMRLRRPPAGRRRAIRPTSAALATRSEPWRAASKRNTAGSRSLRARAGRRRGALTKVVARERATEVAPACARARRDRAAWELVWPVLRSAVARARVPEPH